MHTRIPLALGMHLQADGTAYFTLRATQPNCQGVVTYSGYGWNASGDTINLTINMNTCDGRVTCTDNTLPDATCLYGAPWADTCTFSMSSDRNTLTLVHCNIGNFNPDQDIKLEGGQVYTRGSN